jgi:hypothetical protein
MHDARSNCVRDSGLTAEPQVSRAAYEQMFIIFDSTWQATIKLVDNSMKRLP